MTGQDSPHRGVEREPRDGATPQADENQGTQRATPRRPSFEDYPGGNRDRDYGRGIAAPWDDAATGAAAPDRPSAVEHPGDHTTCDESS